MSGLDSLLDGRGRWKGTYRLWEPSKQPQQSNAVASLTPVMGERFVRIDYTWSYDGEPQEGSLLCGYDRKRRVVVAAWIDSWHMGDTFMNCEGTVKKNGTIDVSGSYGAHSGLAWGWRTVVAATKPDTLRMVMYNVAPDGKEELAVEATFTKTRNRTKKGRLGAVKVGT